MAILKMNFLSTKISMQTTVTIFIPTCTVAEAMKNGGASYKQGTKFQTLWLLHGGMGDDSDYVTFSNVVRYADQHKLAVVMPFDYNMSYNDFKNGPQYFSFIFEELKELCRAFYPLSDKPEDNFVAGLSMGTGGTMKAAMLYPEEFGAALFMSGGGGILPRTGPVRFENAVEVDIPALAKQNVADGKKLPKLFFTCGDKDGGFENSRKSAEAMKELGYDVTWEAVPGYAHEWDFWDLSLRKAFDQWLPLKNAAIEPEEGR